MNDIISKIKELSILEVAQRLGIEVKGKKALCYTGHDKNPSLNFDDKKGLFNCFGCDEGGDQIRLVQSYLKISFKEALRWFYQEFQIHNSSLQKRSFTKPVKVAKLPEENLFVPNSEIYEYLLSKLTLSDKGREYLCKSRNFSDKILEELNIKDIPYPHSVFEDLKENWSIESLLNCGLCKKDPQGNAKFIWWDHVIIFPFLNLNHRIIYIQARRLNFKTSEAKYLNLLGVKPSLYNLTILAHLSDGEKIYLCEGVPDTISAIGLNLKAIGVLGANNFNYEYLDLLSNFQICAIPDMDNGGEIFLKNLRIAFDTIGKTVQLIKIPKPYKDLNEYFSKKDNRS
ncbi:CHC2 zinc finger domain-containing protein [Flavobacterium chilense]|uniref:DNA primase, catalytic core n=1 Tax=Flavobacterium chilense TaxID=946677 RepID=A0A1M6XEZ3_9FLAO|nr:CHC2 zinc finger domain-containing protein [Flavobacterium chilense]SHL04580.1 DNA primase, catalytic core [Flavobacterium chilense]